MLLWSFSFSWNKIKNSISKILPLANKFNFPRLGGASYSTCNPHPYWLFPSWWHQMETFFVLLDLCAGNSPVTGEFPSERPVMRSFDVFFDLCLNKRLSKQSWGWWFEMPSRPLWRLCNAFWPCLTNTLCSCCNNHKDFVANGNGCSFHMKVLLSFINTLRHRQNGHHPTDDIFKCIFLNENAWISFKISLMFVPTVQINNIPALVQIMAWHRPGGKPLSEPMVVSLLMHVCVTRP